MSVTAAIMEAPGALACAHPAPLIDVRDVSVRFGGIVALDRVSFTIADGDLLGLIGPNGAGKTTLFNCFSRLYTPTAGDIVFAGKSILSRPPARRATTVSAAPQARAPTRRASAFRTAGRRRGDAPPR